MNKIDELDTFFLPTETYRFDEPISKLCSSLLQNNYDKAFLKTVYGSAKLLVEEVIAGHRADEKAVRVQYDDKLSFKAIAKHLGFMDDFKVAPFVM